MDNIKNDQYYACKLRDDLAFIVTHMKGIDLEELFIAHYKMMFQNSLA